MISADNPVLRVSACLNSAIAVLAPRDVLEELMVWQRTKAEIDVYVKWKGPTNTFELHLLEGWWSTLDVIEQIFNEMQDVLAESDMAFGEARPPCPGHIHPRTLIRSSVGLEWSCPTQGRRWPAFQELLEPRPPTPSDS